MSVRTLTTLQQLHAMSDEGRGYEVAGGELRRSPLPTYEHGETCTSLATELNLHVRPRGLGKILVEVHFVLGRDPDQARVPDVAFVRADRLPRGERRRGYFEGAPDLAVEVVSPSDSFRETQEKALLFLSAGSRLVWVVELAGRTVAVYTPDRVSRVLGIGDTLDGGDVIPGFLLPVRALFE